jgi:hypothetical protein
MVNYSNGKIYKIEPINSIDDGDIYIGSTSKEYLSQRFSKHRSGYHSWKNDKDNFITSYLLFDKYGIENCKIILLESFPCKSSDELKSREMFYIKSNKCLNKFIPCRTIAEYKTDNQQKIKDYKKAYREKNKEKIREYRLNYYQENKSKELSNSLEYKQQNKQMIIEKMKEPYFCECCKITIWSSYKNSHNKTKRHIKNDV